MHGNVQIVDSYMHFGITKDGLISGVCRKSLNFSDIFFFFNSATRQVHLLTNKNDIAFRVHCT